MNSSLQKALVASMLVVGGSVSAMGQFSSTGFNYDPNCIDPNNSAPYSNPFITYNLETPLWQAGLGIVGTVAWKFCLPNGGSVPVSGRFQFGPGPQGSIQDNLRIAAGKFDTSPDDYMDFQFGTNHSPINNTANFVGSEATSGSGWSFARVQQETAGKQTDWLFGGDAFDEAFVGASNRYMFGQTTHSNVTARLVIDVLGDSARFSWALTNNTTAQLGLGLWLGQWVVPTGGYFQNTPVDNLGSYLGYGNTNNQVQPYILAPGLKPLEVDQRFNRVTDPTNFPAYIDFSGGELSFNGTKIVQLVSPQLGGGMQIVNAPYQNVEDELNQSDQTPVDEVDIGSALFLLDGELIQTNPVIRDITFPDANFTTDACFVQKWQPTVLVPVGTTRNIISYYRSIWGDSNYANGYTAVVDTPKVLSASITDSTKFDPNPFTIRVNVDNTGGFGQVYKSVDMNNVQVTLKLPQGMHAPNNPAQTTLIQYISNVPSRSMAFTDFQVQADQTIFGPQPYSVVIQPSPGASKTVTGVINVAATPLLQILKGANLVTSPWSFSDDTWQAVLAPLVPVQDYQAYTWDPIQQAYILQTSPARGVGSWIVSNSTRGFFTLNGNPKQPTDEFPPSTGAPNTNLQIGWNLIGNPYNYSFPLGQLVGVVGGTSTALTYAQMISQGYIDGSFAYYDPQNQSYNFLQQSTDELLPNYGYWVFATQPITLNFPPVFDLFVRAPKAPPFKQLFNHWKLQLSATGTQSKDVNNFAGVDTIAGEATHMSSRKPPMQYDPHNVAIRAFLTSPTVVANTTQGSGSRATGNMEYGAMFHAAPGKQVYNYSVYTHPAGPITVTWPNLSTLPKNLAVQVRDLSNTTILNARTTAGYSFAAPANSIRTLQVTIIPEGTLRQAVSNVTTQIRNTGATKQMTIGFTTTSGGQASLYVYHNGQKVGTIAVDHSIVAGANSLVWGMTLSNGQLITSGEYSLVISALGDGGDTATKIVTLSL